MRQSSLGPTCGRRAMLLAAGVAVGLLAPLGGAVAQTRGGTLSLIVQPEPPVIVTAVNGQAPTVYVAGKIFQGLLTYGTDLTPRPELAKSWTISPDGLTYGFELQSGVRWHDGTPFTAADAEFSIGTMLPQTHIRTRPVLNRYVASVRATGPTTLEIKLKEPFPPFINLFESSTMPMMPKHLYDGTDYRANPANQKPVGTGPFVFKEWKKGSYIKLARNPDYWKPGLPYLDEVIFNVIPDSASRAVAFERGDVQVLRGGDVDNVDVKRLRAIPGVEYTTAGWEFFCPVGYLILNHRKPPLDNVKVRQAVMHALNRKFIVDTIFFGLGKPASSPFSSIERFYDKDLPGYDFSLSKARQLIRESGVKVGDHPIKILSSSYGASFDRLDEYMKQALESVGLKVSVESADAATWNERTGSWNFDMTVTTGYQYNDPAVGVERLYKSSNIVKGSPFANVQGYSNPKVDELWARGGSTLDLSERQRIYSELQRLIWSDVGNANLLEMEYPTLYRSNVKNVVTSGIGTYETFDTVFVEKR